MDTILAYLVLIGFGLICVVVGGFLLVLLCAATWDQFTKKGRKNMKWHREHPENDHFLDNFYF